VTEMVISDREVTGDGNGDREVTGDGTVTQ